ncbi:UDP-N-acetylmuramoyl-L-alanyl-D-glutamate--2,6-diaminopimelate ligase [Pelagibacterium xiamenense]|uniref:UDP-N-acetylmuramoyl-L-alanyl-D-glutamate--2, 6-diaminopimelate ligase n=1 Tax=Pelagibacterium xiamenense TaxID=2901140 RepID=UPI001E32C654|nr:UDP-N-acetylmuramoyl-L-alanyl-D-glutamate--2,6-diaminopimelate ligase [Pelagibacterium xiamenense]MCD7060140.1 UDP-N-acetylmuramoyl-L-alanyl-D-glutamate--2,6-diaminopimelate ligase [Pelagibacterium xiamenense]
MTLPYSIAELLGPAAKGQVEPALEVNGINADSRLIGEGDLFFALPGSRSHGAVYTRDAVGRGAKALVSDAVPDGNPGVPVVVVEDVRAAYAKAAACIAGPQPEHCVAVTGTNGKTSVVSFLRQIWEHAGIKGASLGTLGLMVGDKHVPGELTTPDALSLHRTLADLKKQGVEHVALEASSHGIDQRRLDGIRFSAVAFTNLYRDHLDYHNDIESYRDAKLRLFRDLIDKNATAVVNSDSDEGMAFMFAALDHGSTVFTVGEGGAHIAVEEVISEGRGQRIKGKLVGEPFEVFLPLVGRFQVSNAVVAAGLAMATGVEPKVAMAALAHLEGAKGRLEFAGSRNGGNVFIDYSHKPEALKVVLETLRPVAENRLIVVFGCGGDRDKGKRPEMGKIASDLADVTIVTDDNPRTEDAATIRAEILAAAPGAREIGNRADAIAEAVGMMEKGDVVLVAGKGHEDYQIIGKTKHHFSDHEVVAEAIAKG